MNIQRRDAKLLRHLASGGALGDCERGWPRVLVRLVQRRLAERDGPSAAHITDAGRRALARYVETRGEP